MIDDASRLIILIFVIRNNNLLSICNYFNFLFRDTTDSNGKPYNKRSINITTVRHHEQLIPKVTSNTVTQVYRNFTNLYMYIKVELRLFMTQGNFNNNLKNKNKCNIRCTIFYQRNPGILCLTYVISVVCAKNF